MEKFNDVLHEICRKLMRDLFTTKHSEIIIFNLVGLISALAAEQDAKG